jgi:hypothetical protein
VLHARCHTLHTLHAERLPNVTATVTNLAGTHKALMPRTIKTGASYQEPGLILEQVIRDPAHGLLRTPTYSDVG